LRGVGGGGGGEGDGGDKSDKTDHLKSPAARGKGGGSPRSSGGAYEPGSLTFGALRWLTFAVQYDRR
jgi:hypothetical protein